MAQVVLWLHLLEVEGLEVALAVAEVAEDGVADDTQLGVVLGVEAHLGKERKLTMNIMMIMMMKIVMKVKKFVIKAPMMKYQCPEEDRDEDRQDCDECDDDELSVLCDEDCDEDRQDYDKDRQNGDEDRKDCDVMNVVLMNYQCYVMKIVMKTNKIMMKAVVMNHQCSDNHNKDKQDYSEGSHD